MQRKPQKPVWDVKRPSSLGEGKAMTQKRESFKARHAKNIAKGPSSAAYWADKVKW